MSDNPSGKRSEKTSSTFDHIDQRSEFSVRGFGANAIDRLPVSSARPVLDFGGSYLAGRSSDVSRAIPQPNSIEETSLKTARTEAQAGEYCLIEKDGEIPWPGIICDEDIVRDFFKGNIPPLTARKGDGTWALYLGSLKCIWVPWYRLKPLDRNMVVSDMRATNDQALKSVYEAIKLNHDLQYWKSVLLAKRLQDEDNRVEPKKRKYNPKHAVLEHTTYRRKVPGQGALLKSFPEWKHADETDDDESHLFKTEVKQEDTEIGLLHKDLNAASDLEAIRLENSLQGGPNSDLKKSRSSTARLSSPAMLNIKKEPISPSEARLYVGPEHHTFIVKVEGVKHSPVLLACLRSESDEWYIMSPLLLGMDPLDFKPIAEYLDHSEYRPNLLDEYTDYARLENIETEEERSLIVVQCGILYGLARQIQLPGLQDLVFRKLKALASYPVLELLQITNLMYRGGPPAREVQEFLVNYIAEHFYTIWESESERLLETMRGNSNLALRVYQRLGSSGGE